MHTHIGNGQALGYLRWPVQNAKSPSEAGPKAIAAALMAVELDDTVAETHHALGAIETWVQWGWKGAEKSFFGAIELNPNYADAHSALALYLNSNVSLGLSKFIGQTISHFHISEKLAGGGTSNTRREELKSGSFRRTLRNQDTYRSISRISSCVLYA